MTILGMHTVAETRALILATEFRVSKIVEQWEKVRKNRRSPATKGQALLDSDLAKFVERWVRIRDSNTLSMHKSVLDSAGVDANIITAEAEFKAINTGIDVTHPRLIAVQGGVSEEAREQGVEPIDLSRIPSQLETKDIDFAALKKLDQAIAAAGNPLGKPGGGDSVMTSPIGLVVIGAVAVTGVVGVLYVRKNLL